MEIILDYLMFHLDNDVVSLILKFEPVSRDFHIELMHKLDNYIISLKFKICRHIQKPLNGDRHFIYPYGYLWDKIIHNYLI